MNAQEAGLLRAIDLPTLGSRVRDARLAKGMTQTEAAAGGVSSPAYICRIEGGQRRPNGQLLEILAARLDTTLQQLLCPPPPPPLADSLRPVFAAVDSIRDAVEALQVALAALVSAHANEGTNPEED